MGQKYITYCNQCLKESADQDVIDTMWALTKHAPVQYHFDFCSDDCLSTWQHNRDNRASAKEKNSKAQRREQHNERRALANHKRDSK